MLKNLLAKASMGLLALAATASVSMADIKINDAITISGFVDMSYSNSTTDTATTSGDATESISLDQFELDFFFTLPGDDKLSARVDLDYQNGGNGTANGVDLEQGFISYALTEQVTINAGRFLSYLGWETAEPTGLYQYSYAYDAIAVIPGYYDGISLDINFGKYSVGLSYNDGPYTSTGDGSNTGFEAKISGSPIENFTFFIGYAAEFNSKLDPATPGSEDDQTVFNVWTSYEWEKWTFAAEYNIYDNVRAFDDDGDQFLLMANYAFDEKWAATVRYSQSDLENAAGAEVVDESKFTISPSYAITDSLLALAEYSYIEEDVANTDTDFFAVELLYTF